MLWIAAYLIGSVFGYGATFAHFQREFAIIAKEARRGDRLTAVTCAAFWPIALPLIYKWSRFKHGLKFR